MSLFIVKIDYLFFVKVVNFFDELEVIMCNIYI